jgi:hypothetical protein
MQGILYETGPHAGWIFIALTLILGGGLAFATGRAIAQTWRPMAVLPLAMLPLAAAVRFLHFALFEETLLSVQHYVVTFAILFAFAFLGYRTMRATQMSTQYSWLYAASGPFGWKAKGGT